jgi:hypothetical protein
MSKGWKIIFQFIFRMLENSKLCFENAEYARIFQNSLDHFLGENVTGRAPMCDTHTPPQNCFSGLKSMY